MSARWGLQLRYKSEVSVYLQTFKPVKAYVSALLQEKRKTFQTENSFSQFANTSQNNILLFLSST